MIEINGNHFRVVDGHVHIFPDEMNDQRESWLLRDEWFNQLYQNPKSKLATVEDLILSMDAAGIDHSVVCGFPWADSAHCDFHNQYMHDAVGRFPRRLSWLAIVAPGATDAATRADHWLAAGAAGMGEFNADAQACHWSVPAMFASVAEVATGHNKPVLIHASEPVGHAYPGKGAATPNEILTLASAFPELRIVAAHWGGGLPFFELMPEVRESLANLVYDSAATTYLYDHSVFEHVVRIAGAGKVIFASDYPVLSQVGLIKRMQSGVALDESALALVLAGNAVRVFNLEPLR